MLWLPAATQVLQMVVVVAVRVHVREPAPVAGAEPVLAVGQAVAETHSTGVVAQLEVDVVVRRAARVAHAAGREVVHCSFATDWIDSRESDVPLERVNRNVMRPLLSATATPVALAVFRGTTVRCPGSPLTVSGLLPL